MNKPEKDAEDTRVDVPLDLDDDQLAQIDALIEEQSTPAHRLTREEMLQILLEKGCAQVEQGESLLPYLEMDEEDEGAPTSPPAPDKKTKR